MTSISICRLLSYRCFFPVTGVALALAASVHGAQLNSNWAAGAVNGNWNVSTNWSPLGVPTNAADTYLVTIDSGIAGGAVVSLNLNATIDKLTLGTNEQLSILNNQSLSIVSPVAGVVLDNNGTIRLNSIGNLSSLSLASGSLIGSGEIVLGNNVNNRLFSLGGVLTQEVGHTIRGAGNFLANTGGFLNRGTILQEGGLALKIDPDANGFTNEGTLQANGNGGIDFFSGTYTNTGQIISVGTGSQLRLNAGVEIVGGTLQTSGTGKVRVVTPTPVFDTVTLNGVLDVVNNTTLELRNGFTNNGTVNLQSIGNFTNLSFVGAQTLDGTGTVQLSNNTNNRILTDNTLLTLGANQTIRGAGQLLANTGGLLNLGTILQEGGVALKIDPNGLGFTNQGTLQATGTGGIDFLSGVYTNTGQIISVGTGSQLRLNAGVEIVGGTLQTSGTGKVRVVASTSVFDTVTLNGVLDVVNNTTLELRIGFTNNGTVNLQSIGNFTNLSFVGAQTLGGTGTVQLSNNTNNRILTDNTLLTLGANQTIRGSGQLLANTGGLLNLGTILQEGGAALTIDPNALGFTNQGTLQATGTGGIRFNAGQFTNTGRIIEIGDVSKLDIGAGTVLTGGILRATGVNGTGKVIVVSNTSVLEGMQLEADLTLNNNFLLKLRDGLVNHATIQMNSIGNATDLIFEKSALTGIAGVADGTSGALLTGTGEVVLSNNIQNRIYTESGGAQGLLVLDSQQTIRGSGQLMLNLGGLYNKGTILQEGPQALILDPGSVSFTNRGTLRATGSGGIRFNAGQFTNTGRTIAIEDVSKLDIGAGTVLTGGILRATGVNGTGKVIVVSSTPVLDGIQLEADLTLNNNLAVKLRDGLVNHATIQMKSIGNFTDLIFEKSALTGIAGVADGTIGALLTGTGEVVLSNNIQNRIYTESGGAQGLLVLDSPQTIRGSGQLMINQGGLYNKGTILQEGTAALILDPGSVSFTNRGTLRATGSGGLTFNAGVFDNTGHVIELLDGSKLSLANGSRVQGGTIQGSGSALVSILSKTPILDGVTLAAKLNLTNNQALQVENGLTNHATITSSSIGNATDLIFSGSQTLAGTGTVQFTNNIQNRLYGTAGSVLTHGAGHSIRGAGQLLLNQSGMINRGHIHANLTQALTIDPDASGFTNDAGGVVTAEGAGRVIFAAGPATNAAGGIFRGDNFINVSAATFQNNGILQPGIDGVGTLEMMGVLPFGDTAELQIQIAGLTQGVEFDLLKVTGSGLVALDGDLKVSLLNGFTPDVSDSFTILTTTGTVTGIFDNDLSGIVSFAQGGFSIDYFTDRVVLHSFDAGLAVIPEPRAFALLIGIFALIATGRRRHRIE